MLTYTVFLFLGILAGVSSGLTDLKFPPDFEFGASTSSYQVEGAWNVSDKSESIWDRYIHRRPDAIADRTTGDVACNSYHLWRRDVEIAEELGLNFYRFSISWPRLLPTGHPNVISEDGKRYYNDLIDGLLDKGIKPLVTLYHFDLPQKLQELGGWANPLISDWFADFARVAFRLFGDRVSTWVTINEPVMLCFLQYEWGLMPPGEPDADVGVFLCTKNVLMSHAKAWRVYDEEFRGKYNGKVSLANQIVWVEAKTPEDENIADIARQFGGGLYSYPIYSKEGGWPPLIEKMMAEKSKQEGYPSSRLPAFTEEEKELIKGTYDYYALNFYTSRVARPAQPGETVGMWPVDGLREFNIVLEPRPEWEHALVWCYSYPEGLRKLLKWIKQEYGGVEIAIMENGYPESHQGLEDEKRTEYLRDHMEQVLLAIKEDGVNVVKYSVWSMIDNFEWISGFSMKFGLYEVDFSSPERTRTPRKSARYYADVIRTRSLHREPNDEL